MGSLRVTLCAGAVVGAALTVSAPPVHAADSGNVSVVPASPTPGSDIQVRAEGCAGRSGTASSKAFVADAQLTRLDGGGPGTLAGETRVRSSLDPGTYGVRITCDGREDKVKGTIRVGDGKPATRPPATGGPDTGPSDAERPDTKPAASPRPSAPASPVAPVRAGGGGAAADLAAADLAGARGPAGPAGSMDNARHAGPGTRHAVVGLVLAGVAAVAVVARGARRSRGRGTE
ncbi:hypothetical protein [Streptomyces griseiscabiei]|uniref:Secreted protein n=1 Tax=Streptomyces griseiscabiei TaxID=2993540 RepID=A0ABU4KZE1_9ACTN|nr:hypothetical protein [Streptomyces griseiscabiei]MBZ3901014.1 hypothetical protein [Streptomyces griseiscabiei]MDX2908855.1 hypothetical protein [Streptomyces griseiscabiei]